MKALYHATARGMLVVMLALLMVGLAVPAPRTAAATTTSALDFQNQMRKLWEDHITWTRLTIVGTFTGDPETPATVQRLLQNQVDIGNAIKPYYGDAAGNQLTALLHDHITGAADLLAAAKANDQVAIKAASDKWYANADAIATFLHNANPQNWPLDTLKAMMKTHLDQTLTEALANLKKDYPADIAAYDAVHQHILEMADAISSGIIKQFPDRFTTLPSDAETNLRLAMRKLWEDHITWTRLTIVGTFTGDPETPATVQRLLQNQVDIGNAIKPYYGDAAGNQLTALLHDHITGAADLLAAAKAGDQTAIKAASDKWYANADDIATFLHNANPQNWPLDTLKSMMKTHLDQTLTEALANLKKDYPADVAAYDAVHQHILEMADAISSGIVAQFPQKFGGGTNGTVMMPQTGANSGSPADVWRSALVLLTSLMLVTSGLYLRRRQTRRG